MRIRNSSVFALAMVGVAGCATLGRATFKEPIVHFQDARVTGLGLTGGAREVQFTHNNQKKSKVDGPRLMYRLMVDAVTFATGELADLFSVQKKIGRPHKSTPVPR